MTESKGVIEFVCEGGIGGSARVCVELRTEFPGIGGTIVTNEGVASAFREEFSPSPRSAPVVLGAHHYQETGRLLSQKKNIRVRPYSEAIGIN
jgi:hypothetical protein